MIPIGARRILVVEDEWIIADQIATAVEEAGYVVVGPTSTTVQALALLASEGIDAALIDINLHGDRSFDLAVQLTKASIPFAFLSGYADADLPAALHHQPRMQKPVDAAELRRCLGALLPESPL